MSTDYDVQQERKRACGWLVGEECGNRRWPLIAPGKSCPLGGLPAFCAMCNRNQERIIEEVFDLMKDDCSDMFWSFRLRYVKFFPLKETGESRANPTQFAMINVMSTLPW